MSRISSVFLVDIDDLTSTPFWCNAGLEGSMLGTEAVLASLSRPAFASLSSLCLSTSLDLIIILALDGRRMLWLRKISLLVYFIYRPSRSYSLLAAYWESCLGMKAVLHMVAGDSFRWLGLSRVRKGQQQQQSWKM